MFYAHTYPLVTCCQAQLLQLQLRDTPLNCVKIKMVMQCGAWGHIGWKRSKYKAVVKGDYKSARQLFWGITKVQGSCLRGLQKYKGVV